MNPFGNKRYNAFSDFSKKYFGMPVQKIPVDAGFTCPNRDGTKGTGGCTYCLNEAFSPNYSGHNDSVKNQIEKGIEFHRKRKRVSDAYLIYFQSFSNTYGPFEKIKSITEEALSYSGVRGIIIGTRPDCISDEILDYYQKLAEKYFVCIEYGVESCYDQTLERINRCHTFEDSVKAIEETARRNIFTGVHLLFGLPGETKEMMLNEAGIISKLPVNFLKIHQLQVIRNTQIHHEFQEKRDDFHTFDIESYFEFLAEFICRLRPDMVTDRFFAEIPFKYLAFSQFKGEKMKGLIEQFNNYLGKRNLWQGKFFQV